MADPHHADDANAYVRGDMAIKEQISTFRLFLDLAKWGSLAVACLVLLLTLWFHPGGNFVVAFLGTVVLAVAGFFALRSKHDVVHRD